MPNPHNSEFKAVGLDFDGTLADSDKAHFEARLLAYEQLAVDLDRPDLARISPAIHAEGHHHGSNPLDINEWVIRQSRITVEGVDLVEEVVKRKKANYLELAKEGLEARPGAIEFATAALRRWSERTAIVTTAHLDEVLPFLARYGLLSSFNRRQLITRESVEKLKPDPEAYEKVRRQLGLKALDRLLAIEDAPHGIAAARAAGATVIALSTPEYQQELLKLEGGNRPHAIAGSFDDISSMLGI